jgi:hypothetical protein
MRRRLRLGQIEFTRLVRGRYVSGLVSRWESGQMVPQVGNLLRLLAIAGTSEEAAPVLEALKAQGFDQSLTAGQPGIAFFPQPAIPATNHRVAPPTVPVSAGVNRIAMPVTEVSADKGPFSPEREEVRLDG